jgi:hypothetical protein
MIGLRGEKQFTVISPQLTVMPSCRVQRPAGESIPFWEWGVGKEDTPPHPLPLFFVYGVELIEGKGDRAKTVVYGKCTSGEVNGNMGDRPRTQLGEIGTEGAI